MWEIDAMPLWPADILSRTIVTTISATSMNSRIAIHHGFSFHERHSFGGDLVVGEAASTAASGCSPSDDLVVGEAAFAPASGCSRSGELPCWALSDWLT